MKRFLALLIVIPLLARAATFTEFYCDATNGNNLWAGSTTSTSPYTKTAGNWVQSTRVYTVQDGTNPSSSVNVGDFASVYPDGSSAPAVYIGRVSAVQNATNGTITLDASANAGTSPANGTGNRTIVVGGVWKGPNAASGFPFTLTSICQLVDSSNNETRINMKNNATYSITASYSQVTCSTRIVMQGYSSTPGDGGKATIDGTTSTATLLSSPGSAGNVFTDLIWTTSFTTGTSNLMAVTGASSVWTRCVFKGARGSCVNAGASSTFNECEFYDCNKSNTASFANLVVPGGSVLRSVFHDSQGGSNCDAIRLTGSPSFIHGSIIDTNAGKGVAVSTSNPTLIQITETDFYNNTGDAINVSSTSTTPLWIENCNFIKNGGAGVNNASTALMGVTGYIYNCGYGAGTQANGASDTLGNLTKTGTVTYASNVTPWIDPANGDFKVNLPAAQGVGRGAFTESQGYSASTLGYPDIAAAQAQIGTAFPTPTPTPTIPPETSHTFGG